MNVCLQPQGTTTTVKAFLKDNFNYEYDRLYICAVVLLAYLAIFWCVCVLFIFYTPCPQCIYVCHPVGSDASSCHVDRTFCVK